MYLNIIKSYRDVIAICDKELLGKKFEQGEFQLDVKENFYKGEVQTQKEVVEAIKQFRSEDATFNIVGEKAVQTAIKIGVVDKEAVGEIAGIPFALILL